MTQENLKKAIVAEEINVTMAKNLAALIESIISLNFNIL